MIIQSAKILLRRHLCKFRILKKNNSPGRPVAFYSRTVSYILTVEQELTVSSTVQKLAVPRKMGLLLPIDFMQQHGCQGGTVVDVIVKHGVGFEIADV